MKKVTIDDLEIGIQIMATLKIKAPALHKVVNEAPEYYWDLLRTDLIRIVLANATISENNESQLISMWVDE